MEEWGGGQCGIGEVRWGLGGGAAGLGGCEMGVCVFDGCVDVCEGFVVDQWGVCDESVGALRTRVVDLRSWLDMEAPKDPSTWLVPRGCPSPSPRALPGQFLPPNLPLLTTLSLSPTSLHISKKTRREK